MTKKCDIGNAPQISVRKESAAGAAAVVETLKHAIGKAGILRGAPTIILSHFNMVSGYPDLLKKRNKIKSDDFSGGIGQLGTTTYR